MDKDTIAFAKWLASTGFAVFIAAYVMGAIPGLPSPISRLLDAMTVRAEEHRGFTEDHAAILRAVQSSNRTHIMICRGVWRGNPEMQESCGEPPTVR